jgi:transposase
MDIHLLFKQLGSIRAVAKQTGLSRNTVRRMLRAAKSPSFQTPGRKSGVEEFKDYLARRYAEHGLSAVHTTMSKEDAWRDRFDSQLASGQSVRAWCKATDTAEHSCKWDMSHF